MKMIFAFEGHNGVGKTTIAKQVSKKLNAKYLYGVDEEVLIGGLKEKFIKDANWYSSALFFLAGSMETQRKIKEIYKDNIFILDRSFWSTLAVCWDKSEEDINKIINIIEDGKKYLPIPNIIFILTAEYEECNRRINMKKNYIDKSLDAIVDKNYYIKERKFYKWLEERDDMFTKTICIDVTDKSKQEIIDICLEHIKKYIREKI